MLNLIAADTGSLWGIPSLMLAVSPLPMSRCELTSKNQVGLREHKGLPRRRLGRGGSLGRANCWAGVGRLPPHMLMGVQVRVAPDLRIGIGLVVATR